MKNSAAAGIGIGIAVIIAVVIGVYALGSQDVAEDSSTNIEKHVTVEDKVDISSSEEEVEVTESSEEEGPRKIKVTVEDGVGVSSP